MDIRNAFCAIPVVKQNNKQRFSIYKRQKIDAAWFVLVLNG